MVQMAGAAAALASSSFAASSFARGFFRALFGEIGDKTFFVALLLTAWCPWEGPRDIPTIVNPHRLIIGGTTFGAIVTQSVVTASIRQSAWANWSDNVSRFLDLIAGCLFALLATRAYLGANRPVYTGSSEHDPLLQKAESPVEPKYNQDAFAFRAPAADGGESAIAGSTLREPPKSSMCSAILGFFVAAVCVFVAESEDKSWYALVEGGRQGSDLLLGAALGFVPAVMFAVLMGSIMWWQLEPGMIRLVAIIAFSSLSIVSFSQALLHMALLDMGMFPAAAPA
mmetsp:Transcript_4825/g.13404  ORF Transcript_4825/g.13404 Transcript_4825/m.13404 type:complete len:284 (+) Transcript_4825:97-948(+)